MKIIRNIVIAVVVIVAALVIFTWLTSSPNVAHVEWSKEISQEDYGNRWPFIVNEGTLESMSFTFEGLPDQTGKAKSYTTYCGIVFKAPDGKRYALNETAEKYKLAARFLNRNLILKKDSTQDLRVQIDCISIIYEALQQSSCD